MPVRVTVSAVILSVLPLVTRVKVSRSVMESPGARVTLGGLVPLAIVVVKVGAIGVNGLPVGTTPVAA